MSDVLHTLRERGFVQQVSDESGLAALLGKGPVSYYCGFDPTASSLHVGSMIPLMALAHLAHAGHHPIAVLGGGTAMVGDPSGRTELRQMLTVETIGENCNQIEPQVRRFLGAAGEHALVLDNAEWLVPLNYLEFLREIGRHFSVNRMLAAEAYRLRLEKGFPSSSSTTSFCRPMTTWCSTVATAACCKSVVTTSGGTFWPAPISSAAFTRRKPMPSPFPSSPRHRAPRWARPLPAPYGFRQKEPALSISISTSSMWTIAT